MDFWQSATDPKLASIIPRTAPSFAAIFGNSSNTSTIGLRIRGTCVYLSMNLEIGSSENGNENENERQGDSMLFKTVGVKFVHQGIRDVVVSQVDHARTHPPSQLLLATPNNPAHRPPDISRALNSLHALPGVL